MAENLYRNLIETLTQFELLVVSYLCFVAGFIIFEMNEWMNEWMFICFQDKHLMSNYNSNLRKMLNFPSLTVAIVMIFYPLIQFVCVSWNVTRIANCVSLYHSVFLYGFTRVSLSGFWKISSENWMPQMSIFLFFLSPAIFTTVL